MIFRLLSNGVKVYRYSIQKRFNTEPNNNQKFNKLIKEIQQKFHDFRRNFEPPSEGQLKGIYAVCVFLVMTYGMYEAKKQRATKITIEDVIHAIKKSETNLIEVVKENQSQKNNNEKFAPSKNKSRKIYLRIDGVDYYASVKDIDTFYEKIEEIDKNKSGSKSKIIERENQPFDIQFRRFFTAINKLILPLLFPLLLYNSSMGKIFKTKVLGQNDGFKPNVFFKDIAGLGNAKIQVSELVDYLRNPSKYKKIGAKVPKGALLSGPPGTGKTMLAKACAGQANVPFFSVSGSEFVQLYAGMGATRVRQLFKNAKKQTPAIIFIDEIDAIGRKRDDKFGGAHDERANTLNQLLVEMDGFGTSEDIIILAATNRKEMLDNALTRPGRFDRIVEIQLPDIKGRQQILDIYLSKIKLSPQQTQLDYSRRLATLSYGFSGADLANLCNQAAILAVRKQRTHILPEDFQSASDRVLAGLQQNLSLSENQKKKIAYHQAGHAVIAWFSEGASPLLKISIVPRSKGSLGFAQYLPNQSSLMNKKQLIDQINVILGGRMSEEYFFKEISSGAADDLMKVRHLARAIVVTYGMSEGFQNYAPLKTDGQNIYSEETAVKIDKEIIKLITSCTVQTRKTVKLYQDKIKNLAQAVLKKQSLNHQEIKAILGERPFEVKENYKEFLETVSTINKLDYVK